MQFIKTWIILDIIHESYRGFRCWRYRVESSCRNSVVLDGSYLAGSSCSTWTSRLPGASIAVHARPMPRVEVSRERRRGLASPASPHPQRTSGTSCRVPGHGHHALAACGFAARERALRYPAGRDVPRYPLGYTPKGRAPVPAHESPD